MVKKFRISGSLGLATILILLFISYQLREQDFRSDIGARNLDATFHVLLTLTAYSENPVKEHYYLPIISLGSDRDKNIPWGATLSTGDGNYIYTSFPPLGFLAPYIWLNTFNLAPTVPNLANFNFVLGGLTALILFFLLKNMLSFYGANEWVGIGGSLSGASISVFSHEVLQSTGIIYWHQSLFQLFMAAMLLAIFEYGSKRKIIPDTYINFAIILLALVLPLTEWTGYLFNANLIFCLFIFRKYLSENCQRLAFWVTAATIAAGLFTVLHFGLAVGYTQLFHNFFIRGMQRSAANSNALDLLKAYLLSYGAFIAAILTSLLLIYQNKKKIPLGRMKILIFILTCSAVPLIENIILMNHAVTYSFDRLKFIFPAAIILAFGFVMANRLQRVMLSIVLILACISGYVDYREGIEKLSGWSAVDLSNRKFKDNISTQVNLDCSIIATNLDVRGYANLLFHHGIFENVTKDEIKVSLKNVPACASIYLEGKWYAPPYLFFPDYDRATITRTNGQETIVLAK